MDLGLGNLNDLKTHILPAGLLSSTESDSRLAMLGSGVAIAFEEFCNRWFGRLENAQQVFTASRSFVILRRYPLETVGTVELRENYAAGWIDQGEVIANVQETSGLVEFSGNLGSQTGSIRITYTGGFWYDTTEDASGEMPEGATPIPADLKAAWIMQVRAFFEEMGGLVPNPDKAMPRLDELLPAVRSILQPYRRLA